MKNGTTTVKNINNKVRNLFIEEKLHAWGKDLNNNLVYQLNKKKLVDTEDLRDSISFKDANINKNMALAFSFLDYGRFQDMGVGAGAGKFENVETNATAYGINNKRKKRRPKKWYTRTVYGMLNDLRTTLMFGFSDQIKARLAKELIQSK